MTVGECRKAVFKFVQSFFSDGTVAFAEQKMVKLPVPYITLKFNGLTKQTFENGVYDQDGNRKVYWELKTTLEMNIYTKGQEVYEDRKRSYCINTAQDDMMEFVKYMEAYGSTEKLSDMGISIMLKDKSIKDLSMILNDTTYRYRAFAEFDVTFTDEMAGPYGQETVEIGNLPNSSGGGKEEYVDGDYYIEEVEITEEE